MARIQTYNIDTKVTVNDSWIGTDGDKQNKTKNFTPIGLSNYFNTSESVHSANSIAFRYQVLKPEDVRAKGTISFKSGNNLVFDFSNIVNILFSKFTLGNNEVDAFLVGLKDTTVILHRSGDINKYGLYKVLDVVEDEDESQFLNFTLSFIQGNSYIQENDQYLFSLIDLDVITPSLQDVIDVDKNADRVRFYKDVFAKTEWTVFNYLIQVAPSTIDDKFYVYGDFTFGGVGNDFARFNADGTYDATFNVGAGFNRAPFASFESFDDFSDGSLFVSGDFTSYNGIAASRIIKLNNNGIIDTSFDYGTGFNRYTTGLALDSNDKLYIGGDFATYKGVASNRIIRLNLDGSIDTSFNIGTGFNGAVIDVKVDSSDKIYVTGYFTSYNGTAARGIIRLNNDGSVDTSFVYGTGIFQRAGAQNFNQIKILSDGKLLVYGQIESYNGTTANGAIKLNTDGTVDATFLANIGTGFQTPPLAPNIFVLHVKETSYGTILFSGGLTGFNGIAITVGSIELNLDGTVYKYFPNSTLDGAYLINNDVMVGLTLEGGIYSLALVEDYYPVNIKELTFSEVTGKAEYKIGGLDSTSEEELLPKRLIREFIQTEAPTPILPTKTSDLTNDGEDGVNPFITLEDIPPIDVSTLVPYTGATTDVDLGEKGISTGFVKFDTTPTDIPEEQGAMFWDEDDNTVDVILNGYRMKIGEDTFYPVKNQSGSTILKGTNVKFAGTVGASGRLLILPFLANGTDPSYVYMGVTAENIANGEDGKVLWFGRLRGLNTNAFNEGDVLYASTTSAGGFQNTIPTGANNIVQVSAVITKSINQGVIFIRPQIEPVLFKPENVANKSINLTSPDDVKYPTTLAVSTALSGKQDTLTNPVTGTGTVNFVPKFTASGVVGNSQIFDNETSVAIGTTTPNSDNKLEVLGRVFISASVQGGNIAPLVVRNNIPYQSPFNQFLQVWQNSVGNTIMSIRADGSLNTLAGAAAASFAVGSGGSVISTAFRGLQNNTGVYFPATNTIGFVNNGVERARFLATGEFTIGDTTAGARLDVRAQGALSTDIVFRVSNSANTGNLLDVRGNGNIGINTTTDAGFRLDVNGTARISGELTVNGIRIGRGAGNILSNTVIGASSGSNNTTGNNNSYFGGSAGFNNTSGQLNSFFGGSAGFSNTTGTENSYFGSASGLNNTGSQNAFFGRNSGRFIADGVTSNTISNNSVFLGRDTRANANNQTNQIVIGDTAIGAGSNTATLGNTSIVDTILRGRVNIQQYATGSRPAYVKGALIYDSTLSKLVVGGASDWEVVTSI